MHSDFLGARRRHDAAARCARRQRVDPRRQEGQLPLEQRPVVRPQPGAEPVDRLLARVHQGELEGVVVVEPRREQDHPDGDGGVPGGKAPDEKRARVEPVARMRGGRDTTAAG